MRGGRWPLLTRAALLTGAALLALSPGAAAAPSARLELRPGPGGAVLWGQVQAGRDTALTGVWSGVGRARLLACQPRCLGVSAVPVRGALLLSGQSHYRVALGGEYRSGQSVMLALRFRDGAVLNVRVPVR